MVQQILAIHLFYNCVLFCRSPTHQQKNLRGSQSSLHRPSDGLQSGTRDRPTSAYIPQKDQYGSPQHGAVSSQVAFCASLKTSWYYITKCIRASSFHFSGRSTYVFLSFCLSFLMCCKSFYVLPCIELEHWTFISLGWSLVLCHILTNIKLWVL